MAIGYSPITSSSSNFLQIGDFAYMQAPPQRILSEQVQDKYLNKLFQAVRHAVMNYLKQWT